MNPLEQELETPRNYSKEWLEDGVRQIFEELRTTQAQMVKRGLQNKVERGFPHAGLPLGYRFDRAHILGSGRIRFNDTPIVFDEPAASLIQNAFYMADTKKYSTRQILDLLTEKGLRSRHGKVLGPSVLWKILSNPFYYGQIRFRDKLVNGKHEPLISRERFDRAQQNRVARLNRKSKSTESMR